jgi:hypothetical protein
VSVARYFYRLKNDSFIREFCVEGATDPWQTVDTLAPDGTPQRWRREMEGDLMVFYPPDGYEGEQGLLWAFDPLLQRAEPMPRDLLERRALNMRVSIVKP